MMKVLNEFKEFAVKGDVVGMGVGIVIGAAFTSIVNSLVKDIFNPLLGLLTKGLDFANLFVLLRVGKTGGLYDSLAQAQADNAITLNIGVFINALISFLIVAFVLFFLVRAVNRLKRPEDSIADPIRTRECPWCFSVISLKATRCPFCTSDVEARAAVAGQPQ